MSYSTVLAVYPGDRVEPLLKMRNSWGTAPYVWNAMSDRYLGRRITDYEHADDLWALWNNPLPLIQHRAVLMFTFDRAYVTRLYYKRMARDIRLFLTDFRPNPTNINHWSTIARLLESNPGCPAIGLWCTSVSGNPFRGKFNEIADAYDPFDWATVVDVYHELDGVTHGRHT